MFMQGCKLIDDDLSVCGVDAQITYQVKLITTLDLELNTVLNMDTDQYVRATMKKYFSNIFVDYVHDVDLSFYSQVTNERVYHENHIIDASEKSFVLYLKSDNYQHLSACNIDDAVNVSLMGDELPETMQLKQQEGDTLESQTTGLFTARLQMNVNNDSSQNFIVPLYMANSGVGIVVDTVGSHVQNIDIYVQDMATDFYVNDSLYQFNSNPAIHLDYIAMLPHPKHQSDMQEMPAETGTEKRLCYGAACFPSRDTLVTSDYAWRMILFITTENGKIAKTTFNVKQPLQASQLRILKARLKSNGEAESITADVGASVDLDWHAGNEFNPEL